AASPRVRFTRRAFTIQLLLGIAFVTVGAEQAEAYQFRRQYYSSWSYRPTTSYHYCRYYYTPTVTHHTHSYHYVLYYPSRPRYRYYYNPVRKVYWGRFEVDTAGKPVGYSMLAKEDRKSSLDDIPESAFPKAAAMPAIPESKDGEKMLPPPLEVPENEDSADDK
ncbi:MAG: hypothetical protein ACR2NZ_18010, partial [Rubripirellula sp.]